MRILLLACLIFPWFLKADPFVDAVSATVKLAGDGASGSGFLIELDDGTHVVASAAHVFRDMKGERCRVIFRAPKEKGGFERRPVEITIRKGEQELWSSHQKHDIAHLKIEIPEGMEVKPFLFGQLATESLAESGKIGVGKEVCIPCYPIGTESNPAGWPVLRRGTIASHPLTPLVEAETFFVDFSSFGGESGAPVVWWQGDKVWVIGVISSMQRQTETSRTQLEEKTTHLPLGLGIAVQSPFLLEMLGEA